MTTSGASGAVVKNALREGLHQHRPPSFGEGALILFPFCLSLCQIGNRQTCPNGHNFTTCSDRFSLATHLRHCTGRQRAAAGGCPLLNLGEPGTHNAVVATLQRCGLSQHKLPLGYLKVLLLLFSAAAEVHSRTRPSVPSCAGAGWTSTVVKPPVWEVSWYPSSK